MAKLSPSLKRLILHRGDPPALSAQAVQRLDQALASFGREAERNGVKDEAWMVLTVGPLLSSRPTLEWAEREEQTAAIVAYNRPSAFPPLWSHIRSLPSPSSSAAAADERLLSRASLLRESALKTISFTGIAKAINSLASLSSTISSSDPTIWSRLSSNVSARRGKVEGGERQEGVFRRGEELWRSVYRPLDEKLLGKLEGYHPDLPQHIVYNHYGPLLADPPSPTTSPATSSSIAASTGDDGKGGTGGRYPGSVGRIGTSLVAIGTLRASGELGPQLLSHVFGLQKAGEEILHRRQQPPREGEGKEGGEGEAEVGKGWEWLCGEQGCTWAVDVVDRVVECVGMDGQVGVAKAKL